MKQTRSHPGYSASGRPAEWFRDFVRQVSPTADPASVMLFVQLLRANNRLVQVAEKELSTSGLSWAKFRLLMNLEHSERHPDTKGLQPSELSEMQGISRNTASALIASLERDGLITRELHGTDRRRFVIRLTPDGHKLVKNKLDSQLRFLSQCFDSLSPQERNQLAEMLTRLNEQLREQVGCPAARRS